MSQENPEEPDLIDEIIRMSDFSFERLPMLEIISDRLAAMLPVALSELTQSACEASVTNIDYVSFAQAISGFPEASLLAVAQSPALGGDFLVVMDGPLVISCLDSSFGGEPLGREIGSGNSFTSIECGFGNLLANLVLSELRQAFYVVGDITPEVERIETDTETATVTQQANLCVSIDLGLKVGTQICRLIIVFPYDAFEPIRPQLSKVYFGERGDEESPWRDILTRQIESATVELEVVLSETKVSMQQFMEMKPGDQFSLTANEDSEIVIFCSGTPLYTCVTGTKNNGIAAVQITDEIDALEEA